MAMTLFTEMSFRAAWMPFSTALASSSVYSTIFWPRTPPAALMSSTAILPALYQGWP